MLFPWGLSSLLCFPWCPPHHHAALNATWQVLSDADKAKKKAEEEAQARKEAAAEAAAASSARKKGGKKGKGKW